MSLTAYMQKETELENWDVNGAMLSTFLQALVKNGALDGVKQIFLVTGTKQYGVHLGAPKNFMLESDPWLTDSKWRPSFCHNQQNILHSFCKEQSKGCTVTYPNDITCYVVSNYTNLTTSIALHDVVPAEFDSSISSLISPGSPTSTPNSTASPAQSCTRTFSSGLQGRRA